MLLGLVHINMGSMSEPDRLVTAARAAEEAGFDSLWAGEHLVLPDPQVPPSPMAPRDPALDSLFALCWAAAHTSTIRLATGIVILPQRNPVVLAKEVATLDVLSEGRVMLGIGSGYLEPEFRAVGADFENRGVVTDEYLDAMASLWYDERPAYHGRFANFEGVDAHPRPRQRPIPLIVGGHHPPAFRRAISRAHGWYGYWLSPEQTADAVTRLRAAADRVERRSDLGELEISVTPNARLTPALVEAYAGAGVHRLVPFAPPTADGPARTIEVAAAAVAGLTA
jgi:probable F420-dependent oxidoreductase